MTTFTQLTPAALDEAAAIVEAEWMRLQRQGAVSVEGHFAEPAESPAPHMCRPRIAIGVACVRRPGPPPVREVSTQLTPKEPRLQIWATERSPPAGEGQQ
jgi:hypothetical protein